MSDGVKHFKKFRDFVIVKVTPALPGTPHHHYIVCIIKVKWNDDSQALAEEQMTTYMTQAADLPLQVPSLCRFLMVGRTLPDLSSWVI